MTDFTGKRSAVADSLPYGFVRLEAAVTALAERGEGLQQECADLRGQLSDRNARLNAREAELIDANQLRQEVGKRIDELIAQIDLLDGQLEDVEQDYRSWTTVAQLSNRSAYLGYQLVTRIGLQISRKRFDDEQTQRVSAFFLTVHAGLR